MAYPFGRESKFSSPPVMQPSRSRKTEGNQGFSQLHKGFGRAIRLLRVNLRKLFQPGELPYGQS